MTRVNDKPSDTTKTYTFGKKMMDVEVASYLLGEGFRVQIQAHDQV